MYKSVLAILLFTLPITLAAQVFEGVKGEVHFFSEAPFENVEASNSEVVSYYDMASQYVLFDLEIKSFEFNRGMMHAHFNENYMHSDEYPKAEFFGKVYDFDANAEGVQEVNTVGELTIHGVTNVVKATGRMMRENDRIYLVSKFNITIADFEIDSPRLLFLPVADQVDVTVEMEFRLTGS
ncbi:MAG: YceI family protein [Cyclobacteriaceae bacterium]